MVCQWGTETFRQRTQLPLVCRVRIAIWLNSLLPVSAAVDQFFSPSSGIMTWTLQFSWCCIHVRRNCHQNAATEGWRIQHGCNITVSSTDCLWMYRNRLNFGPLQCTHQLNQVSSFTATDLESNDVAWILGWAVVLCESTCDKWKYAYNA